MVKPSGWLHASGRSGARLLWSYKGAADKLCGHRESGVRDPCGAPAAYRFELRSSQRNPGFVPQGITCADHAVALRSWPTLERMRSL